MSGYRIVVDLPVGPERAAMMRGKDLLIIPATREEAEFFRAAVILLVANAQAQRQELAMHHWSLETKGVGDPEVAASLTLLLEAATQAAEVADAFKDLVARTFPARSGWGDKE